MRTSLFVCIATSVILVSGAAKTENDAKPLSAIDWLSDVVAREPVTPKPHAPVTGNATAPSVSTLTLDGTQKDAVGLLPLSVSGLDAAFWGVSSSAQLSQLIAGLRVDLPPPLARLVRKMMLAELAPPIDSTPDAALFVARLDRLLAEGALDRARALLNRSGHDTPELFARWFDISLLTDHEDEACKAVQSNPALTPTVAAYVLCLARANDWQAAETKLQNASDQLPRDEGDLLARFINPELFEGAPFLPVPKRITPLNFQMHRAIGEPLSQAGLPRAFAFAGLSPNEGWKTRIQAAERLFKSGAIPASRLRAIYSERQPAASGGIWTRADMVQDLSVALKGSDVEKISQALMNADATFRRNQLGYAFAEMFNGALTEVPLSKTADKVAIRMAVLAGQHVPSAKLKSALDQGDFIAIIQSKADLTKFAATSPLEAAVQAGLTRKTVPPEMQHMIDHNRQGEAVLSAITLLQAGVESDVSQIEDGLAVLCRAGFDDTARKLAIYLIMKTSP